MQKKYQVFISSTYKDLIDERFAVSQTLLDCDCIPVGMEQFPASGMSQMEYIKKMLNDCDYYILILAGKYGSIDSDGIGYTEKEYDYAKSIGLPVMSFVIKDIKDLPVSKYEESSEKQDKLKKFREKVCSNNLVKFYSTKEELQKNVSVSLMKCIRDFPAIGWVRANKGDNDAKTQDTQIEDILNRHTLSKTEIEEIVNSTIGHTPKSSIISMANSAGGNTLSIDEIIEKYTNQELAGSFSFDYSNNNGIYTIGFGEYVFDTKWSKGSEKCIYAYSDSDNIESIARIKAPVDMNKQPDGKFNFSSRCRRPQINDAILWKNRSGYYALTKIIEIKDDTRGANNDMLTCEYVIFA